MTRIALAVLLAASLALVACGKVGKLDQPAPLYGEKAKADYAARKAAAANAKAAAQAEDTGPPEPLQPSPGYDPTTTPGSLPPNAPSPSAGPQ